MFGWRLLVDEPTGAARNMAVDEALYQSARDASVATVRLYAFEQPTVSLGYRQAIAEAIDEAACRRHGVSLVRRITGGFALLHQNELTWSVTAPTRVGPFRNASVRETYRMVNGVLMKACESLGARIDRERSAGARARAIRNGGPPLPCLAAPSDHEITSAGMKLVPSAQRRHRLSLLQHGSILLAVDETLWNQIRPRGSPPGLQAVGLSDCLSESPSQSKIVDALVLAFTDFFGTEGLSGELDAEERASVRRLEPKYASAAHLGSITVD